MKQLKKMALKEAAVLTDSEKKMVLGGNSESETCNISTTCSNGTTISIYYCNGNCSSDTGKSVTCRGTSNQIIKQCLD